MNIGRDFISLPKQIQEQSRNPSGSNIYSFGSQANRNEGYYPKLDKTCNNDSYSEYSKKKVKHKPQEFVFLQHRDISQKRVSKKTK